MPAGVRSSRASQTARVSAIAVRASFNRANCASISLSKRCPAARTEWQGWTTAVTGFQEAREFLGCKSESNRIPDEEEPRHSVFGEVPKPASGPWRSR